MDYKDIYEIETDYGVVSKNKLVMLRLPTDYGYSNTWWLVLFCDIDNTFIGKLEKHHWYEYTEHKKGDVVKWDIDKIQHIWEESEEFCYSDNITICECKGLCRNK